MYEYTNEAYRDYSPYVTSPTSQPVARQGSRDRHSTRGGGVQHSRPPINPSSASRSGPASNSYAMNPSKYHAGPPTPAPRVSSLGRVEATRPQQQSVSRENLAFDNVEHLQASQERSPARSPLDNSGSTSRTTDSSDVRNQSYIESVRTPNRKPASSRNNSFELSPTANTSVREYPQPQKPEVPQLNLRKKQTYLDGNWDYGSSPTRSSPGNPLRSILTNTPRDLAPSGQQRQPQAATRDQQGVVSPRDRHLSSADVNHSTVSSRDTLDTTSRSVFSSTASRDGMDLNRSYVSQNGGLNQSLNRSVLNSTTSPTVLQNDPDKSGLSRSSNYMRDTSRSILSSQTQDRTGVSLAWDPYTSQSKIPTHQQNGGVRSLDTTLNQSSKSLTLSGSNIVTSAWALQSKHGVLNSLFNLVIFCVLSLIVSLFSIQLIYQLDHRQRTSKGVGYNSMLSNSSYQSVLDAAVVLCSFVLMLDLCCLMVCCLQWFYTAKLLKCPQGEDRAFSFLKESIGSRFVSIAGFFASVPIFILAFLLFIMLEFRATPAIISTVILIIGILFIIANFVYSTYLWSREKQRANDCILSPDAKSALNQSELSTLV